MQHPQPANLRELLSNPQNGKFAETQEPLEPGQTREKVWKRLQGAVFEGERETQARRALEFWTLQGLKYGVVYDIENIELLMLEKGIVLSRCKVLAVIPGERITSEQWRAQNSPASLVGRMGLA